MNIRNRGYGRVIPVNVPRPFGMALAIAVVLGIGLALMLGFNVDSVRADSSVPGAPTGLVVWVSQDGQGMTLTWTAPQGTVTGYQILREGWEPGKEPASGCDQGMVVHVNDTGTDAVTYTDTDVAEGVRYSYRVKAINANGVGPQSRPGNSSRQYRPHNYWPSGTPGTPGDTPSNLEGEPVIYGTQLTGIELTWDAPDDEVTGYQILRRLPRECEIGYRVYVENTNSTDTSWTDTNVESHNLYEYHVRAINDVGVGRLNRRESASVLAPGVAIAMLVAHGAFGGYNELTIALNNLDRDDDSDTLDYILRGDVTLAADGTDADECEGDGLGEDVEIYVVDEQVEYFDATVGAPSCGEGTYTVTLALNDGDGVELLSLSIGHEVGAGHLATFPVGITWLPAINGTAQVGETLTADTSRISDDDGLDNATFSYQWVRNDGTDDEDISGATSSTYTLVDDDEGNTIKVKVSYTDDADNDETLTSRPTATIAAKPNSAATGAPTISGMPQVGQTLTASTSGISDADGLDDVSYSYQWLADDTDIDGATSSTYTVQSSDNGKVIKVRVSFNDDAGNEETLSSAGTSVVVLGGL